MEALDFVKFHNLYAHFSSIVETAYPLIRSRFYGDDQDEDSFFDLDFISPRSSGSGESPDQRNLSLSGENELCFSQRNLLLSQSDLISKRKILPIELSSKPESPVPVSIPKSAPRLSISLFKKPKLMAKQRTDETDSPLSLKLQSTESKRFTFKLNRVNSSRNSNRNDASEHQSKRFCGEGMQKYLKLIKPLYVKVSRKPNYSSSAASSPVTTTATSFDEKQRNISIGIRVVCRRLGKSKSSSSATGMAVSPTNRRDDSLLQQDDGIESAILHCKRSFSATRDDVDGTCDDNQFGTGDLQKEKAGKDVFSEAKEGETTLKKRESV
ncbi:probable membrane-associated kinase regulator 5 [Cucurbita moschata]|uniref:Probable membrane-associated kinase regulator 5 n=1 Tax=Cucurbita moschata TaxID=3662 RepID=A0A6J1G1Z9_CUCMO|nr:probable membrane-associated kinase regulator 5 [Cucurbita moschata]